MLKAMTNIHITRGHDINIAGKPAKRITTLPCPKSIKITPDNFKGIKPKLLVKEGENVKVGTKLFYDKVNPEVFFCSTVAGQVKTIKLGDRRKIEEIEITCESNTSDFSFSKTKDVGEYSREEIKDILLNLGLWPSIRQRPFSKIANSKDTPKSIFVSAMPTAPFSMDLNYVLNDAGLFLKEGFKVLSKLTDGSVNLVVNTNKEYDIFDDLEDIAVHGFSGPHPAGNVGIHIHHIDPIADKDDIVWYISLQDVNDFGRFFKEGVYPTEKYISVGGASLSDPSYYKIKKGAVVSDIVEEQSLDENHILISGDVLSGQEISSDSSMNYYSDILSVIPYTKKRDFLGWILPGLKKYSLSRTFLSSLFDKQETSFDTRINGSRRAIIPFGRWEKMLPMDIIPDFLVKSILAGDIEDMEKYGIYECDHEDFALCAYACQSKIEVSKIVKEGLELMEKEG